jgi:hypothetical protein
MMKASSFCLLPASIRCIYFDLCEVLFVVRALVLPMMLGVALCGQAQVGGQMGGQAGGQRRVQTQTNGQQSSMGSTSTTGGSTVDPFELRGRVLNARSNVPIARALVHLGARAALTNQDGVYSFPQVTSSTGLLVPSKPGYYASASGNDAYLQTQPLVAGTSVDLLLYPEAVIAGVVANAAGEGLPNFTINVRRSSFDENGHHWTQTGFARTDTTGAYRQVVPAGDYTVQAHSLGRVRGDSEIYLPVSVPADSMSIADALHLKPGDVAQVNLRPEAKKAYVVSLTSDSDATRGFPRVVAYNTSGLTIPATPIPERGDPGTIRVLLPNGTYRLAATMQTREGSMEGEAHVTVAGHDVEGVTLHYSQAPRLPIELSVEPGVSTDNITVPTARTLGLMLTSKVENGDGVEQNYPVASAQGQPDGFAVPVGSYRFQARASGQWYVTSADYGGTNLLTDNLTMALGGGAQTVRIRISNQTAAVSGTVTIGDQPVQAFLYFVATGPSATPVLMIRGNADGSFNRGNLPPGGYRVLAMQQRIQADLRDPATMSRFLGKVQTVTLTAGSTQTLTMQAVPSTEIPQ